MRWAVVAVVVVAAMAGACAPGAAPTPDRALLYPASTLPGYGPALDTQQSTQPYDDEVSIIDRLWSYRGFGIEQRLYRSRDIESAEDFYGRAKPRIGGLGDVTDARLVGHGHRFDAGAAWATSEITCTLRRRPNSQECLAWSWWARHGDMLVLVEQPLAVDYRIVPEGQFAVVARAVSAWMSPRLS